ncbi:hypothetical protein PUNSTDRAFT_36760, partial [Punctularia strigosozonata HHB-11173 SS5]
ETRYMHPRIHVPKSTHLNIAFAYAQEPAHHPRFVNMIRMEPRSFAMLVQLIQNHTIFQSNGRRPQAPVEWQLLITLYRLGHYGNGASVMDIARQAGCSEGTETEVEKIWVEQHVGLGGLWREGWVMYDGTIIVLFEKPGLDGEAYYTRKGNYGLNLQVGNVPSNL